MTPWAGSTTPIDEMEEESLKILTEMFGSREEAI